MEELPIETTEWSELEREAKEFLEQCQKHQLNVIKRSSLGMALMVGAAFLFAMWQLPDPGIVFFAVSLMATMTGNLINNISKRKHRGADLAHRLLLSDNPRAIPLLMDLSLMDGLTRSQRLIETGECIQNLLPFVREEHAHLFKPQHLFMLYGFHKGTLADQVSPAQSILAVHSHALSMGVLQALGYIGDQNTLRWLTKIAESPAHTDNEREEQRVAEQSIQLLKIRLNARMERDTYLRASEIPTSHETLLRPASQVDEQVELLLRPINSQE